MTDVNFLDGKKTYLAAVLLAVWSILGLYLGKMDSGSSVTLLLQAFGLLGLRSAIGKKQ